MADSSTIKGDGQTILLVEDEALLLATAEDQIEKLGYTPMIATSGEQALTLLRRGAEVDLLLTDVVMPGGINGFELAGKARELRPALPVIYISGHHEYPVEEIGQVQAPLLQKPVSPGVLADAIVGALSNPSS